MYQNFLGNVTFVTLFLLMLWSWVQPFIPLLQKQTFVTFGGMCFANITMALLLVSRWADSGHFPLSNLYESLIFLAWSFTALHLICHLCVSSTASNSFSFLGAITSPIALFTYAFASFSLPPTMQKASALVPALQSNWLMMHVTIMILSYAALLCGSLFAFVFLLIPSSVKFRPTHRLTIPKGASESDQTPLRIRESEFTPFGQLLDNLSYRILGFGFPLLTMGILSGAVWANEAWGSYWSWDPKETWAFITWLVFAIYLHIRLTKGWCGTKPAILATVGFVTVWICYLGVNILGNGLHSYGWFTSQA